MTQIVIDSKAWTGRGHHWPDPITALTWWIYSLLWPSFDCADCVGMIQHGCECAYKEAVAPGCGPEPWRVCLRGVFNRWVGPR